MSERQRVTNDGMTSGTEPRRIEAADLRRRYEELARRHGVELRLAAVQETMGGIAGLINAAAQIGPNPLWLIDRRQRIVSRSVSGRGSDFRPPDINLLLERHGPIDLASPEPILIPAEPVHGVARRHLLVPVARDHCLFAWLVVAEVSARLGADEAYLAHRTAFHLATEYSVQRRVARASWNARGALARQLVRGSHTDGDLIDSAEYLGVRADAARVLVYVADRRPDVQCDEQALAETMSQDLGAEVLATHGKEGGILLVEVPDDAAAVAFVHRAKGALHTALAELGETEVIAGVSAVVRPEGLQRAYREAREVVQCIDRFARSGDRVIAVDDLGPARLFVANSDIGSVRRYVHDVLGALLIERPGTTDLLRTLQCFFDTGRSVRESAARLGIHENTVRLRMAKVHDLTGLDVAGDANDQLSAQTALLVLRLEGHSAISSFAERASALHQDETTPQEDTA